MGISASVERSCTWLHGAALSCWARVALRQETVTLRVLSKSVMHVAVDVRECLLTRSLLHPCCLHPGSGWLFCAGCCYCYGCFFWSFGLALLGCLKAICLLHVCPLHPGCFELVPPFHLASHSISFDQQVSKGYALSVAAQSPLLFFLLVCFTCSQHVLYLVLLYHVSLHCDLYHVYYE